MYTRERKSKQQVVRVWAERTETLEKLHRRRRAGPKSWRYSSVPFNEVGNKES